MAFGAGALISALTFDLTEEAFATGGTRPVALGLAAGAVAFYVGDRLIARIGRKAGPEEGGAQPKTHGLAIVLGALLDGIPESIVLGASLLGGLGVSVSFLAAVAVSNLPEGLAGTRDLLDEGHSRGFVLGVWVIVALASSIAAGIGFLTFDDMRPELVAIVQAFAAGAILTMLADTMIPESHEQGGAAVSLMVVFGFAVAFFLGPGAGRPEAPATMVARFRPSSVLEGDRMEGVSWMQPHPPGGRSDNRRIGAGVAGAREASRRCGPVGIAVSDRPTTAPHRPRRQRRRRPARVSRHRHRLRRARSSASPATRNRQSSRSADRGSAPSRQNAGGRTLRRGLTERTATVVSGVATWQGLGGLRRRHSAATGFVERALPCGRSTPVDGCTEARPPRCSGAEPGGSEPADRVPAPICEKR